jgi:tripartite-type tricarboxylate transporter receptor subunit TctC
MTRSTKRGISRRGFLAGTAVTAVAPGAWQGARAQAISGTARILVGFPPGGTTDVVARVLLPEIKSYATSAVIENRPGAGGRVALEALKSSSADGSVLTVTPLDVITLNPHIYKKLRYDGLEDFAPVTTVCLLPNLLTVSPRVPADVKTLADFIAWCRANPSQATYGTPGAGTPLHFVGVMLARAAGFDFVHVPYLGSAPAVQDLLGGQIACTIAPIDATLQHVNAGRLRAVVTTGPKRSVYLPDVPTIGELGYPAIERVGWWTVFLPARTPAEIADRLNAAVRDAVRVNEVKTGLTNLSAEVGTMSRSDFAQLVRTEYERWGSIVQASGFTPQD